MKSILNYRIDLRELFEQYLGQPLAANAHAGLWLCPVCPPQRHGLLMVAADEYKCLTGYSCGSGASEWMQRLEGRNDGVLPLGVLV
jgi:hypothetical protein